MPPRSTQLPPASSRRCFVGEDKKNDTEMASSNESRTATKDCFMREIFCPKRRVDKEQSQHANKSTKSSKGSAASTHASSRTNDTGWHSAKSHASGSNGDAAGTPVLSRVASLRGGGTTSLQLQHVEPVHTIGSTRETRTYGTSATSKKHRKKMKEHDYMVVPPEDYSFSCFATPESSVQSGSSRRRRRSQGNGHVYGLRRAGGGGGAPQRADHDEHASFWSMGNESFVSTMEEAQAVGVKRDLHGRRGSCLLGRQRPPPSGAGGGGGKVKVQRQEEHPLCALLNPDEGLQHQDQQRCSLGAQGFDCDHRTLHGLDEGDLRDDATKTTTSASASSGSEDATRPRDHRGAAKERTPCRSTRCRSSSSSPEPEESERESSRDDGEGEDEEDEKDGNNHLPRSPATRASSKESPSWKQSQVVTLRNEAGETEDHVLVPLREMLERFGCAGKNGRGPGGPDGAGEHSRSRPRKLQANLRLLKAATSAEASLERQRAKSSRGFWHSAGSGRKSLSRRGSRGRAAAATRTLSKEAPRRAATPRGRAQDEQAAPAATTGSRGSWISPQHARAACDGARGRGAEASGAHLRSQNVMTFPAAQAPIRYRNLNHLHETAQCPQQLRPQASMETARSSSKSSLVLLSSGSGGTQTRTRTDLRVIDADEDMMESLQDHSEMFFRTADDGDFGYHEERDSLMSGGDQRLTASSRSTPNLLESGTRLNLGPQLRDDINHNMRTTSKSKESKTFAEMSIAEKRGVFVGKWLNTEQQGFEQVLRANGANMVQVVGAKMVNYGVGKSAHEFFLSSSRKNGALDLLKEVHTGGLAGSHAFKFQLDGETRLLETAMGNRLTRCYWGEEAGSSSPSLVIEMHDPKRKAKIFNVTKRVLRDENTMELIWECRPCSGSGSNRVIQCVRTWKRCAGDAVVGTG